MRVFALLLVATALTACIEDTNASRACTGTSSRPACKACCRAQGDKNFTYHWTTTKHLCMCEF